MYKNKFLKAVVEITVGHQLKPSDGQELPTKKVTENLILTNFYFLLLLV